MMSKVMTKSPLDMVRQSDLRWSFALKGDVMMTMMMMLPVMPMRDAQ